MKIGLFFGSFNPIHTGHLLIASYMASFTDLDQVWFVVSPQNPLKKKGSLANVYDRLEMVKLAIGENDKLYVCDAELKLNTPSYTIDTLSFLTTKYPQHDFSIIMGADTVITLPKWKNADLIIGNFRIYIYPRPGYAIENLRDDKAFFITNTPMMELSSTFIRQALKEGKNIQYWVPTPVLDFIAKKSLYTLIC